MVASLAQGGPQAASQDQSAKDKMDPPYRFIQENRSQDNAIKG